MLPRACVQTAPRMTIHHALVDAIESSRAGIFAGPLAMKETPAHHVISHALANVSMACVEIGVLKPANLVSSLNQYAVTSKNQA